jgi:hypothetical protein
MSGEGVCGIDGESLGGAATAIPIGIGIGTIGGSARGGSSASVFHLAAGERWVSGTSSCGELPYAMVSSSAGGSSVTSDVPNKLSEESFPSADSLARNCSS